MNSQTQAKKKPSNVVLQTALLILVIGIALAVAVGVGDGSTTAPIVLLAAALVTGAVGLFMKEKGR